MDTQFSQLPVEERIRLVEDLWDSFAKEQSEVPLTSEQAAELDRRIAAFEQDQRN
ncbi:addiction module protein [Parahaliea aestuarii]|uniref:Addiction module protein n=1 Tax=Parahaliea aestuarii TaxID=1852021 RepID=A0A5C9A3E3_9GAMM|nr:addiction module protein [Parahaliea aestuarii]TXS94524.1 addiction module protein [Parahaliea aestuarii]